MSEKNIQERSRVLRIALDQGVLNLKELRSFLVSVEVAPSPITGKNKRHQLREQQMGLLNKKSGVRARTTA
jgi:hypothetical protein